MSEHTRAFQPVYAKSLYSGQTLSSQSYLYDNDINTYATLKGTSSTGAGIRTFYRFDSLSNNATLKDVTVGSADIRWRVSAIGRRTFWLYRIEDRISTTTVFDQYAYGDSVALFNPDTSATGTVTDLKTFKNAILNLLTLKKNVPIDLVTLKQTVDVDGNTVSRINLALGIKAGSSSTAESTYINMFPMNLTYELPNHTLTFTAGTGGIVNRSSFVGDEEESVTVTATASSGYEFDHWSDGEQYTNATRSFVPTANKTYSALFKRTSANIFNGSNAIASAYLGSTKLNGIYLGSNKLL